MTSRVGQPMGQNGPREEEYAWQSPLLITLAENSGVNFKSKSPFLLPYGSYQCPYVSVRLS
ncbi:MAG: hypothetical protein AAGJ80_10860, partial [Cyanobacteria bacterium J06553_1]